MRFEQTAAGLLITAALCGANAVAADYYTEAQCAQPYAAHFAYPARHQGSGSAAQQFGYGALPSASFRKATSYTAAASYGGNRNYGSNYGGQNTGRVNVAGYGSGYGANEGNTYSDINAGGSFSGSGSIAGGTGTFGAGGRY